jgi:hypothetical protein
LIDGMNKNEKNENEKPSAISEEDGDNSEIL